MAGTTYKWVSEQRLLYFTQKLKQHIPEASDFIDDTVAAVTTAYSSSKVDTLLSGKVDKVDGKGLSTNDYTTDEKTKLAGLENYTLPTASDTVKGGIMVGDGLTITGDVLSADHDSTKVDKVDGKGLSTNDFTNAYKQQLDDLDLTALLDDTTTTATDKTWSASKIYQAISAITGIEFIKPADGKLPETGKNGAIYLIPISSAKTSNAYDEYIWLTTDSAWEKIGTTEIDLSGYVQDTDMVEITTGEIDTIMTTVFGS